MLYRLPMDRDGLLTKVYYNQDKNTLTCSEHGDMNVVAKVEYKGKIILWYRCVFCNVGAAYDGDPSTNPSKEEIAKLDPNKYLNHPDPPEPLIFVIENLKKS